MKKYWNLFFSMLKIGLFTFGGGYAMIALLENEFLEKKKYMEKDEFLDMVAIAESTPGPIAINAATIRLIIGVLIPISVFVISTKSMPYRKSAPIGLWKTLRPKVCTIASTWSNTSD